MVPDAAALKSYMAVVLASMTDQPVAEDLPLDVRATAFQARVWQALRRIPRGETRSYAELAKSLGQPTAVRAVARACATNPVAIAVPCHRVIGSDGSLTGYRWGERKCLNPNQAPGCWYHALRNLLQTQQFGFGFFLLCGFGG
jgi:AraC family transcriptional regulator of adaptative response/methylated-DNA-[protein]-cysteine methyltransferase